ncbi:hypothetical protein B0H19DRAFT_1380654 [Mycena capillaripes]|nr:hypothetical protein B0H19DRAFT_1380654 [Mycena capillaripes]
MASTEPEVIPMIMPEVKFLGSALHCCPSLPSLPLLPPRPAYILPGTGAASTQTSHTVGNARPLLAPSFLRPPCCKLTRLKDAPPRPYDAAPWPGSPIHCPSVPLVLVHDLDGDLLRSLAPTSPLPYVRVDCYLNPCFSGLFARLTSLPQQQTQTRGCVDGSIERPRRRRGVDIEVEKRTHTSWWRRRGGWYEKGSASVIRAGRAGYGHERAILLVRRRGHLVRSSRRRAL